MLWTSAVSYATESDVYGCHKIESITNKTVIDTGLNAQLIDNIEPEDRTKIQLAALVASGPEIGVSIFEAVAATRLLRQSKYADRAYIGKSADEIRLALAKKDLQGFDDAWEFVRTHPRGGGGMGGLGRSIIEY
ncbi:MAG: hypothetical protein IPK25_08275 [Saprospiraceae bacterium]|nr:hypothetical protein [Saprospiraceae bacterium]